MNIREKVSQWDQERGFRSNQKNHPHYEPIPSYIDVLDRIEALRHCGFDSFDQNLSGSFYARFLKWLEQFSEEEQKFAFLACSRIMFITHQQIKALQHSLYERKIRRMLLEAFLSENGLPNYRFDLATSHYPGILDRCLFVELSDSGLINSFFHVNIPDLSRPSSPSRRLQGPPVETLVGPMKASSRGHITQEEAERRCKELVQEHLIGKDYLFLLENFAGSGQTALSDIKRILLGYPQLKKIVFCPYVCTSQTKRTIIEGLSELDSDSGRVEILEGLEIPDSAKAFSLEGYLWEEYDLPEEAKLIREQITEMCGKYWDSHHHRENDPYDGELRIGPGGYKDGQLMVILASNCPNNSLPLLWSCSPENTPESWHPLFERAPRY